MTEKKAKKTESKHVKKEKFAVVLIRGLIGINKDIKKTLYLLKLRKKHVCVVIENNESNRGMLKKAKDYITYGEIDEKTLKELLSKRGKEDHGNKGKLKPFFELAPPRKGFERKGTKKSFMDGGALGYRGNKINDLVTRMI